jgi:hypothetical protein
MGMTDDYLESLYRTLYESELERSDKLDAQVNLPTAIVTGLLAVSAFYIEHFPKIEWRVGVILFILSLIAYWALLMGTMYCLVRSYFKHKYQLLPPPGEIQQNVDKLRVHYEAEFDDGRNVFVNVFVDENVKGDIQHDIVNVYKESGSFNRSTNTTRIAWLHWATHWIVFSIVALVASRLVYYFGVAESKPQEVKITEMPGDSGIHRVEIVGRDVQKVEVVNPPSMHRVQIVNPPQSQKVEITGLPDVQKVEIITPKKETK